MKNKYALFIDATDENSKVCIFDVDGKKIIEKPIKEKNQLSEKLLIAIDDLLKDKKISKKDIFAVLVNPGPGSYTSIRIAVTVANLTAFSLDIPILKANSTKEAKKKIFNLNNENFLNPVLPIYQNTPHITKKKTGLG